MKSESIKEITAALAKAQLAFLPIKKTEKVDYATTGGRKKYNYAPLVEVIEATKKALSDNGLAVTQPTYIQNGNIILETLLSHISGEWLSGELYVGKCDQPPQSEGSSLTYKRRYGMSAILCVSSEEDDDAEIAEGSGGKTKIEEATMAEHFCKIHNTPFFKKGKMKQYAHPLDNGGWCNEEEPLIATSKPTPAVKDTTQEVKTPQHQDAKAEGSGKPETPTFKNRTDFQRRCATDYGLMTPLAICAQLGIDSIQDLDDLDEAFARIAELSK